MEWLVSNHLNYIDDFKKIKIHVQIKSREFCPHKLVLGIENNYVYYVNKYSFIQ